MIKWPCHLNELVQGGTADSFHPYAVTGKLLCSIACTTVACDWNQTPVHKYYINRITLSQDYIPWKCCYPVFELHPKRYWATIHHHGSRFCKIVTFQRWRSGKKELPWFHSSQASQIYLIKLASNPKCQICFLTSIFDRAQFCSPLTSNDTQ